MPHPAPQVTAAPPPIPITPARLRAMSWQSTATGIVGQYADLTTLVRPVSRPFPATAGEGRDHAER